MATAGASIRVQYRSAGCRSSQCLSKALAFGKIFLQIRKFGHTRPAPTSARALFAAPAALDTLPDPTGLLCEKTDGAKTECRFTNV